MEDIVGKYSERICHQLASEGMITKEDIPLCAYNLQVFIERTIVFAFIFMISAFRGYLIEVVVFVISFASIRKYSGVQNPLQRHADSANDGTVIPLATA